MFITGRSGASWISPGNDLAFLLLTDPGGVAMLIACGGTGDGGGDVDEDAGHIQASTPPVPDSM